MLCKHKKSQKDILHTYTFHSSIEIAVKALDMKQVKNTKLYMIT
jgi:hypothetical protein